MRFVRFFTSVVAGFALFAWSLESYNLLQNAARAARQVGLPHPDEAGMITAFFLMVVAWVSIFANFWIAFREPKL